MTCTRLAYYQAHHDCREIARNTLGLSSEQSGRAYIVASWVNARSSVLVTRNYNGSNWAELDANARAALRAEIARELDCASAALTQNRVYGADKALARRAIDRARWLRRALADC